MNAKRSNFRRHLVSLAVASSLALSATTGQARAIALEQGLVAFRDGHYAQAVPVLKRYAERGNAAAQVKLAAMYENGLGMPRDAHEAAELYRRAARQGNAEAQFRLGIMYLDGVAVTPNESEALQWISRAAFQGHKEAEFVFNNLLQEEELPLGC